MDWEKALDEAIASALDIATLRELRRTLLGRLGHIDQVARNLVNADVWGALGEPSTPKASKVAAIVETNGAAPPAAKKRGGRPKGSKNKVSASATKASKKKPGPKKTNAEATSAEVLPHVTKAGITMGAIRKLTGGKKVSAGLQALVEAGKAKFSGGRGMGTIVKLA